jgi:hypothetical protein
MKILRHWYPHGIYYYTKDKLTAKIWWFRFPRLFGKPCIGIVFGVNQND